MKPVAKWKRFLVSSLAFCLVFQMTISGIPALERIGACGCSSNIAYADTKATAEIIFDGTQSTWAEAVLIDAYEAGLTYPGVMGNYTKPITREEFATIAVRLYEKMSGKSVQAGASPFGDTANPEVVKANQLGIVLGTAPGTFSPNANIKRQEMAAMIMRALSVSVAGLPTPASDPLPFSDRDKIASWALESVKFAYQNNIINGMGNDLIAPLANTTREQAIAIIKRAYDTFSGEPNIKAIVRLGTGSPPIASEQAKFKKIDFSNRLTAPDYDTRLTLYAATGTARPAKPASAYLPGVASADFALAAPKYSSAASSQGSGDLLGMVALTLSPTLTTIDTTNLTNLDLEPVYPISVTPAASRPAWWTAAPRAAGSFYSKADCAAFIDWSKSKLRYFSFTANNASGAANVVWQVSRTPFSGFSENWTAPRGLVAKGTVPISSGEFAIDFGAFAPAAPNSGSFYKLNLDLIVPNQFSMAGNTFKEIPKTQYKYYVRAVPVTAAGVPLGDPGEGIEVLYGKPVASSHETQLASYLELWTTLYAGAPGTGGEFPNLMKKVSQAGVYPGDSAHWFQLKTPAQGTTKVVMQVSAKPFTNTVNNWEAPVGLAYSKSYSMPLETKNDYANAVNIPFSDFGPSASSLAADKFVDYYVRAVAIRPSNTPGTEEISFSDTVLIKYGTPAAPVYYTNKTIAVPSYTPSIRILHYEPIKWEDPDWAHRYIVYRAPRWNEIGSFYKNQSGDVLAPYAFYAIQTSPYYDSSMTVDKYEDQLIPKFLKENTKVFIPAPTEADKSWWEELWDGIVDFFSDMVGLIKDLTNWVSNAYNDLREGLIDFVASNFPLIPDDWRAGLKDALEVLANTGLAALGLPPSLPNFDQLTDMSVDYLASVALTQAGIPANDITDELMEETIKGIGEGIESAANSPTPNPISAPFLKADPDYLYRPAYLDVELYNTFDKPSLPGTFSIDAEWEWTENVHLDYVAFANKSTSAQFADAIAYTTHFVYGLSRGHLGYPIYYTLFEPIRSQPVPILQPGEATRVRIYLKEYIGKPYAFAVNGDAVYPEDFAQMYFGTTGTTSINNGKSVQQGYNTTFKVYIDSNFNLPSAQSAAQAMGLAGTEKNCIYTYNYIYGNSGETFEQIASKPYK